MGWIVLCRVPKKAKNTQQSQTRLATRVPSAIAQRCESRTNPPERSFAPCTSHFALPPLCLCLSLFAHDYLTYPYLTEPSPPLPSSHLPVMALGGTRQHQPLSTSAGSARLPSLADYLWGRMKAKADRLESRAHSHKGCRVGWAEKLCKVCPRPCP